LIFLTSPADACHIYRVWHYPKSQKCFTALAHGSALHQHLSALPPERIDIPLPALDWIDCPPGDERMRGIALMRDLRDGPAQR
jgi:hypothetical protein